MTEKAIQNPHISFEEAFERLEKILEVLNGGKVALEESLHLFEEADRLIMQCNQRLSQAEQKVQTLIKNRNGELCLDKNQKPEVSDFIPPPQQVLSRNENGSRL